MADPKYRWAHQKLREAWQARMDAGELVFCHEPVCVEPGGRLIRPGSGWHLSHVPDGTEWTGPSHPFAT